MAVNITNRADARGDHTVNRLYPIIFQDAPKNSVFMGMAKKTSEHDQ